MNYDMSSYFEDPEFKEALARYEGMVENHTPAYFEADELTDIAEYYASKGRHKDADKAINLAIQLHPDNIDALIFRARSLMLLGKKEEAQMVMQLINNPADREFRFLQADLLIEEEHMEEADKILQQLAMKEMINPDSLNVLTNCYVEKYLADAKPLDYLQFQRIGYFNVDKDSTPENLVFNRTVSLKDTWSKINK